MWFALCLLAGLAVGGVIAWLLAKERTRKELAGTLEATLSRAGMAEGKAAALDATLIELREQIEQQSSRAEEEIRSLGERFAAEHEGRVRAETERKEVLDRLEEEKQLLAQAREKLTDAFKGLEKANEAYNSAVRSLEARVFPAARKFKDFGVVPGAEIPVLIPVETTPGALQLPEENGSLEKDE